MVKKIQLGKRTNSKGSAKMRCHNMLSLLLFLLTSCGGSSDNQTEIKIIRNDSLFVLREDSTLKLEAPLKDSRVNGQVYSYDIDGNVESMKTYVNDVAQGYACEYYPSGITKREWHSLDGQKFGEVLEYHDHFQDSIAKFMHEKWWITPVSTKLSRYSFYDLTEKEMYFRSYDTTGNLITTQGRIFQATFFDTISAYQDELFSQEWVVADISHIDDSEHMKMKPIEMHYFVTDLSGELGINDTIYTRSDSTSVRWIKSLDVIGTHEFQAVAYLFEGTQLEYDTSRFTVLIKDRR